MPSGKQIEIKTCREILYFELLGLSAAEIAEKMSLNAQTVLRVRSRDEYIALKSKLAQKLLYMPTHELIDLVK